MSHAKTQYSLKSKGVNTIIISYGTNTTICQQYRTDCIKHQLLL